MGAGKVHRVPDSLAVSYSSSLLLSPVGVALGRKVHFKLHRHAAASCLPDDEDCRLLQGPSAWKQGQDLPDKCPVSGPRRARWCPGPSPHQVASLPSIHSVNRRALERDKEGAHPACHCHSIISCDQHSLSWYACPCCRKGEVRAQRG